MTSFTSNAIRKVSTFPSLSFFLPFRGCLFVKMTHFFLPKEVYVYVCVCILEAPSDSFFLLLGAITSGRIRETKAQAKRQEWITVYRSYPISPQLLCFT